MLCVLATATVLDHVSIAVRLPELLVVWQVAQEPLKMELMSESKV